MDDDARLLVAAYACTLSVERLRCAGWLERMVRIGGADGADGAMAPRAALMHPAHAALQNMHAMRLERLSLEIELDQPMWGYARDCVEIPFVVAERAAGAVFVVPPAVEIAGRRVCARLELGYLPAGGP